MSEGRLTGVTVPGYEKHRIARLEAAIREVLVELTGLRAQDRPHYSIGYVVGYLRSALEAPETIGDRWCRECSGQGVVFRDDGPIECPTCGGEGRL